MKVIIPPHVKPGDLVLIWASPTMKEEKEKMIYDQSSLTRDQWEHIGRVMDHFDFDKVQKMMNAVGWEWWGMEEPEQGLIKAEISKLARDLLVRAVEGAMNRVDNKCIVGTGGLEAEYDDGVLTLKFIGASSEYWVEWLEDERLK